MAKPSVPRKPRPPKGSGLPVAHPPKGLTLADITIAWGPPDRTSYITGATVAKLIGAARSKHRDAEGHDPKSGTLRVGPLLRGLGGWVFPDAGAPHPALESEMRFFLSEFLSDVAAEIEGDGLSSDTAPSLFTVHVGPPRTEWTQ